LLSLWFRTFNFPNNKEEEGFMDSRTEIILKDILGPSAVNGPIGDCPTDEELAVFAEGNMTSPRREEVIAHILRCDDCFEVLSGTLAFLKDEKEEL
jgi:hypothetical protein